MKELSEQARKRVELLLGMYVETTKVKINENEFTLRTLKVKELKEIFMKAQLKSTSNTQLEYEFNLDCFKLAYSLKEISGIPIDEFLGIKHLSYDEKIEEKFSFIENFEVALSGKLAKVQSEMQSELDKKINENVDNLSDEIKK